MSISSTTRKILWARSGNRCAICSNELVKDQFGTTTISGEECHIVSSKERGPRHRAMPDYDIIENLILLCQEHHKMIDENPNRFSEAILQQIKEVHESKMRTDSKKDEQPSILLAKADHVTDIIRCLNDAEQYATDYPKDREEDYSLFATFLDLVNNFDVIDDKYDEFGKIDIMNPVFKELSNRGYVIVCGKKENCGTYKLLTAFVIILKKEQFEKGNFIA